MEKVENELKWAAVLEIAQSSHLDIVTASLAKVLDEIQTELAVVEKGSDKYYRLAHLETLFGGCLYAVRGVDGIVTGMVVDMLDNSRK